MTDDENYDKILEENIELRNTIHGLSNKLMDCYGEIGKLKSLYPLGVIVSFIVSLVFGIAISFSLSDSFSWNCTIGSVIGVWFSSLVVYYGCCRAKYWN